MKAVRIIDKQKLNDITYKLTFGSGGDAFTAPGQFARLYKVNSNSSIVVPVAQYDSDRFVVVVRATDDISLTISRYEPGAELEAELGIGSGFDVQDIPSGSVLAAEGEGIPLILGLLRQLMIYGKDCRVVLGYATKRDAYLVDSFRALASNLEVVTADGSNGRKGHINSAIRNEHYVCTCASKGVLMKIYDRTENGQFICMDNPGHNAEVMTKDELLKIS